MRAGAHTLTPNSPTTTSNPNPPPPNMVQLDPHNVHAFFNRGISHDKLGDPAAAVEDFSSCIALDPGNAVAFYNRAAALDALGQYERAVADYRAALDAEK